MENIKGKYALITGGSRGLGKATALALAAEGVNVAITGRNLENLKSTAKEIEALGVKSAYIDFDVSDIDEVNQAVQDLTAQFGKFDILINNAGIASFGTVNDMDPADWTKIIQTNVLGTYYVTKAILPQLIEKNEGDIINISSTAG